MLISLIVNTSIILIIELSIYRNCNRSILCRLLLNYRLRLFNYLFCRSIFIFNRIFYNFFFLSFRLDFFRRFFIYYCFFNFFSNRFFNSLRSRFMYTRLCIYSFLNLSKAIYSRSILTCIIICSYNIRISICILKCFVVSITNQSPFISKNFNICPYKDSLGNCIRSFIWCNILSRVSKIFFSD